MKKYEINDPWDWVTHFESEIANYTGYKYGIACDSNSNAIRLLLHYLGIKDCDIEIPARTYVSVPNQIILSGNRPKFIDYRWAGEYKFGNVPIVDAATGFYNGMSHGYEDSYMVLSFHLKKIINIGQGGMILTNDEKFNEWARPMIYDGRHKDTLYTEDEFECIGWHMYMSPESAKRGLEIFWSDRIQKNNPKFSAIYRDYKDLRLQKIFWDYIENPTYHFGCSFTENITLFDIENIFIDKNFNYVNDGLSSSSNFKIFEKFKKNAKPNSTCIIQWSSLTRPNDENSIILQTSDNPLYDLLEQWYDLLEQTQKISKERNIKLIQYIGWAQWKDSELNDYHRDKLNSFDITWFQSQPQIDLIFNNCFQIDNNWSRRTTNENLFYWDGLEWGGMSEWIRENIDIDSRYIGVTDIGHFDSHPTEYATKEFIEKVLIPMLEQFE